MKLLIFALISLLTACMHHFSALTLEPETTAFPTLTPLPLGNRSVWLEQHCQSDGHVLYLRLHANETTAGNAMRTLAEQGTAGCFVLIDNQQHLQLTFQTASGHHSIDPNKIFSATGRHTSLQHDGGGNKTTLDVSTQFAQILIKRYLQPAHLIIALHNNNDGATDIHNYLHPPLAQSSAQIFIDPKHNPSDYAWVTSTAAFDFFKAHGFNVVQQNPHRVADDGSLSVYAAQHHIGYINIEAQYHHVAEQHALLQTTQDFLAQESS